MESSVTDEPSPSWCRTDQWHDVAELSRLVWLFERHGAFVTLWAGLSRVKLELTAGAAQRPRARTHGRIRRQHATHPGAPTGSPAHAARNQLELKPRNRDRLLAQGRAMRGAFKDRPGLARPTVCLLEIEQTPTGSSVGFACALERSTLPYRPTPRLQPYLSGWPAITSVAPLSSTQLIPSLSCSAHGAPLVPSSLFSCPLGGGLSSSRPRFVHGPPEGHSACVWLTPKQGS